MLDLYNEVQRRKNIILSFADECIDEKDLDERLEFAIRNNVDLVAYDGMEPSGKLHIGHGLLRTINTNKLIDAGFKFKFYIADWFAKMNMKFNGDMNLIHNTGVEMMILWDACGMKMENVEFVWASEEITRRPAEYWQLVLDISTKFNVEKVFKCSPKLSYSFDSSTNLSPLSSQILYPIMQCADIFFLNVDICSLGMDQRETNLLAREYCHIINLKKKPILIHHHMLLGVDGKKMSKSNPEHAIFMEDSTEDITNKIIRAVPEAILEYYQYIIFELETEPISISTIDIFDDNKVENIFFDNYDTLYESYLLNKVNINQLKDACCFYILKYIDEFKHRLYTNIY
jgi:tyrosyl-tRNA synthetase